MGLRITLSMNTIRRERFLGSIINVGVTPLRCHFQHYFFAKKISIQDSHTLQ